MAITSERVVQIVNEELKSRFGAESVRLIEDELYRDNASPLAEARKSLIRMAAKDSSLYQLSADDFSDFMCHAEAFLQSLTEEPGEKEGSTFNSWKFAIILILLFIVALIVALI